MSYTITVEDSGRSTVLAQSDVTMTRRVRRVARLAAGTHRITVTRVAPGDVGPGLGGNPALFAGRRTLLASSLAAAWGRQTRGDGDG